MTQEFKKLPFVFVYPNKTLLVFWHQSKRSHPFSGTLSSLLSCRHWLWKQS